MDINDSIRVVTKYIFDRKGIRVDLNVPVIMTNERQRMLLSKAFKVAVEYYNGTNIVV
jgi:hypothetical protein